MGNPFDQFDAPPGGQISPAQAPPAAMGSMPPQMAPQAPPAPPQQGPQGFGQPPAPSPAPQPAPGLLDRLNPQQRDLAGLAFMGGGPSAAVQYLTKALSPQDSPMSVREWEYYNKLPEKDQQRYLNMKRSAQYLDLGYGYAQPNPNQPGGVIGQYQKGIGPQQYFDTKQGRVIQTPPSMPGVQPQGAMPAAPQPGMAPPPQPEAGGGGAMGVTDLPMAKKQRDARQRMTSALSSLTRSYMALDRLGGIVNPDRSGIENLGARAASSDIGQSISGAFGTEEQSLRQRINNMRPLLINSIRQASEMGARGLDSEKELQFYMQAATDPARDLLSNLAAIDILDDAYGLGGALKKTLPKKVYERVKNQAVDMRDSKAWEGDGGGAPSGEWKIEKVQ